MWYPPKYLIMLLAGRRRRQRPHKVMKRMIANRPQPHRQPQTPRSRRPQYVPLVLNLRSIQRDEPQKAQYANGHRYPPPHFGIVPRPQRKHLGTPPNGPRPANDLQHYTKQQRHNGKQRERRIVKYAVKLARLLLPILQYDQESNVRRKLLIVLRIQKVIGHGQSAIAYLLPQDLGRDDVGRNGMSDSIELIPDEFGGIVQLAMQSTAR
mmetsp:Transcript_6120/g.13231  ORF Transcript_6120/g.13231 Transcript_6120/m.13231 type:complete len:209 (-) Transcript_6120:349-975(-)